MQTFLSNKKIQLLIIVILTLAAYSNIFSNQRVIDDFIYITENSTKTISETTYNQYRPIRDYIFIVYSKLFGTNLFFYHLQALLVLLGTTVLVYLIVEMITRMNANVKRMHANSQSPAVLDKSAGLERIVWVPFVTALLFGLHPVHTEAITFMISSVDMIGALFFFGAFYSYIKSESPEEAAKWGKWRIVSVFWAILAYFTYELTLVLPLLIFAYSRIWSKSLTHQFIYWLPIIAYGFLRFFNVAITNFNYLGGSFYDTQILMAKIFLRYLVLLIWPVKLSVNHIVDDFFETFNPSFNDLNTFLGQSIFELEVLISILVLCIFLWVALRYFKKIPIVSFGVIWVLITILPFANILAQPTVMAERYLFMTSFGFILALGYFLARISNFQFPWPLLSSRSRLSGRLISDFKKIQRFLAVTLVVTIALAYGVRTYVRNFDWKDEVSLWNAVLKVYPKSALTEYYLGYHYQIDKGNPDEAIVHFERALEINPRLISAYINLSYIYITRNDFLKAEAILSRATLRTSEPLNKNDANAKLDQSNIYFNLGIVYLKQEKTGEARANFKKALEIDSNNQRAKKALDSIPSPVQIE